IFGQYFADRILVFNRSGHRTSLRHLADGSDIAILGWHRQADLRCWSSQSWAIGTSPRCGKFPPTHLSVVRPPRTRSDAFHKKRSRPPRRRVWSERDRHRNSPGLSDDRRSVLVSSLFPQGRSDEAADRLAGLDAATAAVGSSVDIVATLHDAL